VKFLKQMYIISKQNGISLIEIMLGLSVIAAVVIMSTVYYNHTHENQRRSQLVSQVAAITQASQNYMRNRTLSPSSMNVTTLVSNGGLSPIYTKSPWGGTVTISVVNTSQVQMKINGVPNNSCVAVKKTLDRSVRTTGSNPESAVCSSGTGNVSLTVKYDIF
jgi:type II secretory pathway pseudopilin PulG